MSVPVSNKIVVEEEDEPYIHQHDRPCGHVISFVDIIRRKLAETSCIEYINSKINVVQ